MATGPVIGLDIGTQQIKFVEMRPTKSGLTVTSLGVGATPFGVLQNNIITDPQLMGQTIRQLLKESGATAKRVIGTVAGQSAVVIRIIEVPKMTELELKETMKWEVERHVPFAPSETVIDYHLLPSLDPLNDSNPNMEVLLAVAQQDIVNNYIDTTYAAKLDPVGIDIEPLATARALIEIDGGWPVVHPQPDPLAVAAGYVDQTHRETVAIINIGASNTEISIFTDGQLSFPRSLPLAGDSLTRAVAEMLGYPLDQAERIKVENAEVQLDRMAIYTGTAYGDEAGYEAPQFREGDEKFETGRDSGRVSGRVSGRISGRLHSDSGPIVNPFDITTDFEVPIEHEITGSPLNLAKAPEPDETTGNVSKTILNLAGTSRPDAGTFFDAGGVEQDLSFLNMDQPVDTGLRDHVFEAIAPILSELATEIRRSLDYYRSRAQGRSVDRVIVSGGTANLKHIDQFLQAELQVPVSIANPFSGMAVSSKNFDPAYLRTIASGFTIAVGLAAREAVFEANPLPKKGKAPKAPKQPKAVQPSA
jgi:type IV pilus assembly protein PilM